MNKKITNISILSALYVALCFILAPISFGAIQLRISETLCLLSIEYKWSIISLTLGCFISNLLFGGLGIIDIVFGTIATFLACLLAYRFRNIKFRNINLLSALAIVLTNGLIIGIEFGFIYQNINIVPISILEITISEFVTIFIFGLPIYSKLSNLINKILK